MRPTYRRSWGRRPKPSGAILATGKTFWRLAKPDLQMMHEEFDPYYDWLAIPAAEQPPTYYRLLGLRHLEADAHLIARAIRLRIAHVRGCDDGRHPEHAAELLRQIAAAGETLLDPAKKARYDASLGGALAVPAVAEAPGPRLPAIVANRQQAAKPHTWLWRLTAGLSFVCLVLGAAVLWLEWFPPDAAPSYSPGEPSATRGASQTTRPPSFIRESSAGARAALAGDEEQPSGERTAAAGSGGPRTLADLMQQAGPEATDPATLTGRLAAARMAMFHRNLAAAAEHVAAAAQMAKTRTELGETSRVEKLLAALEGFWESVQEGLARLDGGVELAMGAERVMVVEADQSHLLLRMAGTNQSFHSAELPALLAVVVARQGFTADQRTFDLQVGAFHAIDKYGDRFEARQRLENGGAEGQLLLAELALAPEPQPYRPSQAALSPPPLLVQSNQLEPAAQVEPSSATDVSGTAGAPQPGVPESSAAASSPTVDRRLAVPSDGERSRAEQQIREVFGDQLRQLNTVEQKGLWAGRLLQVAESTGDDPAAAYVLYQMASDLAVQATDLNLSMRVADQLGGKYQVDPLLLKADVLERAWQTTSARNVRSSVGSKAAALVDAALAAGNIPAADRLIRLARRAARAENDLALLRQLDDRARQIQQAGQAAAAQAAPVAEQPSPGERSSPNRSATGGQAP